MLVPPSTTEGAASTSQIVFDRLCLFESHIADEKKSAELVKSLALRPPLDLNPYRMTRGPHIRDQIFEMQVCEWADEKDTSPIPSASWPGATLVPAAAQRQEPVSDEEEATAAYYLEQAWLRVVAPKIAQQLRASSTEGQQVPCNKKS